MRDIKFLFILIKIFLTYNANSINLSPYNEELKVFIKDNDIIRAKENILKHKWAENIQTSIIENAKWKLIKFTDEYINHMISEITPSTTTICPNCIKKD